MKDAAALMLVACRRDQAALEAQAERWLSEWPGPVYVAADRDDPPEKVPGMYWLRDAGPVAWREPGKRLAGSMLRAVVRAGKDAGVGRVVRMDVDAWVRDPAWVLEQSASACAAGRPWGLRRADRRGAWYGMLQVWTVGAAERAIERIEREHVVSVYEDVATARALARCGIPPVLAAGATGHPALPGMVHHLGQGMRRGEVARALRSMPRFLTRRGQ